jgi:oxaloacetate decarboxylase alpha subunit
VKTSKPAADTTRGAWMGPAEVAEVRRLIRLVQRTGIGELEVSSGGRTVRISAFGASTAHASPAFAPGAPAAERSAGSASQPPETAPNTTVAITSPMVGTFYRAPAPDADPYLEVGDTVDVGQTVCIVEAMKLMNEIESEVRGKIVKVLVENAQPVEYGQSLFLVEPV